MASDRLKDHIQTKDGKASSGTIESLHGRHLTCDCEEVQDGPERMAAIAEVVLVHSLIWWWARSKALALKVLGIADFATSIKCDTQCRADSDVTVWGLASDNTMGERL